MDTETTGLDTRRDRLLEVAAVRFVGGEPVDRFQSLVRYRSRLPLRVEKLTGLRAADLSGAPPEEEVLARLMAFLGHTPLVGHNVAFDQEVLGTALKRHKLPPLKNPAHDTLLLSSLFLPTLPSHKLALVARALGLVTGTLHRAEEDALLAGRIFVDLHRSIPHLPPTLRALFSALLSGHGSGGLFAQPDSVFAAVPLVDLLSTLTSQRPWPAVPPPEEIHGPLPSLEDIWQPGGLLARQIEGFEAREEQVTLARAVEETLDTGGALVAEAGTGVGKSWAYLFGALKHALEKGERVFISTHTRQLQDQLWHKDLPTVERVLNQPVTVGVVKGKGNYLCLDKMAQALEKARPENALALALLCAWVAQSEDGDLESFLPWAQLNVPGVADLLASVSLDEHHPCRRFCANRPQCFLSQRDDRLARCQVVILNHALLMTLLGPDGGEGLFENAVLIVDEAHHLEDMATQQFSHVLSQEGLGQLRRTLDPTTAGSLMGRLAGVVSGDDLTLLHAGLAAAHTQLQQAINTLQTAVWAVGLEPGNLFQTVKKLWWDIPVKQRQPIEDALDHLHAALNTLHTTLGRWRAGVLPQEEDPEPRLKTALTQTALVMSQAESLMSFARDWMEQTGEEADVAWLECVQTQQGNHWRLWRTPLSVQESLPRQLAPFKSLVFTSATLAVGQRFEYFLDRTGLSRICDHPVRTLLLKSPFDYANHLRLYVPQALIGRGKGSPHELEEQTAQVVQQIVGELGGGVMVLFNSIRELKNVAKKVRPQLEKDRKLLLVQFVDGTRQALSQEFRDDPDAVLFGTRSFFEGLDFKGDTLRVLALTKLPFPFLKEPIIEARMKAMKTLGQDPNRSYYQPMAIFLLRQAVGRVIRSHTDRGVVFLLDERLLTQSYGPLFLDNLPPCPVEKGDLASLLAEARGFLDDKPGE